MEMKYQVVRNPEGGESAILHDKKLNHDSIRYRGGDDWTVISAGFCGFRIVDGKYKANVWGRSETLDIDSRKEDCAIISRLLNGEETPAPAPPPPTPTVPAPTETTAKFRVVSQKFPHGKMKTTYAVDESDALRQHDERIKTEATVWIDEFANEHWRVLSVKKLRRKLNAS